MYRPGYCVLIERCTDYRRIKKFPDWRVCVSDEFYYLMDTKDGADLGLWTFHEEEDGAAMHASFGLGCTGEYIKNSAIDAIKWMFENTNYNVIYAAIPNDKRPAQIMAKCVGMEFMYKDDDTRYYKITNSMEHHNERLSYG